jgi:hypothetical protein
MVVSRAEEYRRLARECLEAARTVQDEDGRTALLQMAQVWSRLADEQADDSGEQAPPVPSAEDRPVVLLQQQQQQQIQPKDDDNKD